MKKPIPPSKGKIPPLTKNQIAELLGIKCAGLLVIVGIGEDGGVAKGQLFIECNDIFLAFAKTKFERAEDAEDAVGRAMDIFWELFWKGKYVEMNKFVGFVNTIILRLANTVKMDIDKNRVINVDIEEAIGNQKNDGYFEDKEDINAIIKQEHINLMDGAVATFSEKDRTIYKMKIKDEMNNFDIADALDITEGYLRKALSRIQEKIKLFLGL
jgi:RNA polymerase sigma factor (sigma-70 family)